MAHNSGTQGADKGCGADIHILGESDSAQVGQINASANSGTTLNTSNYGNGFWYQNQSTYASGANHFNATGGTTNVNMGRRSRSRSPRRESSRSREPAPFSEDRSNPVSPRSQNAFQSPDQFRDSERSGSQQTTANDIATACRGGSNSAPGSAPAPVPSSPTSQALPSPHPSYAPSRHSINPCPSPQQTPDRGRPPLSQTHSDPTQDALPLDWHGAAPRKYYPQHIPTIEDAREHTQPLPSLENSGSIASHAPQEGNNEAHHSAAGTDLSVHPAPQTASQDTGSVPPQQIHESAHAEDIMIATAEKGGAKEPNLPRDYPGEAREGTCGLLTPNSALRQLPTVRTVSNEYSDLQTPPTLPQGSVHDALPEQAAQPPPSPTLPQKKLSPNQYDAHQGAEDAHNGMSIREIPRNMHWPNAEGNGSTFVPGMELQSSHGNDDEGKGLEVQSLGESIVEPDEFACVQTGQEGRKKRSIFKRFSHWFAKRLIGLARRIEPSAL